MMFSVFVITGFVIPVVAVAYLVVDMVRAFRRRQSR